MAKKRVLPLTGAEIEKMIEILDDNISKAKGTSMEFIEYRRKLMFILGISLGVDLRSLRWSDILDQDSHRINDVEFDMSDNVKKLIKYYSTKYKVNKDDYVFASKENTPMNIQTFSNMVKTTAEKCGITKEVGMLTLKKTWGLQKFENATDQYEMLLKLQKAYNHPTTKATLRYIGKL